MNRNYKLLVWLPLIFVFLFAGFSGAKDDPKRGGGLDKTAGQPQVYKLNINNISTFIFASGETDINGGNPGLEYPKGSNRHPVYQSGFVWGASVNGQIRVGGTTFNTGLAPGAILPDGTAEDPDADDVRMWRVRPDWETGNVSTEIREGEGSESEIRAQYEKDWVEWPAQKGAPYEDVDSNGVYDPAVDIPGFPGAHQTIWFVTNDLDPDVASGLYGSPPMGVEVQITIWAYASVGPLGNMDFRRYKIINKSQDTFQNMYVSAWSDADVGSATDDFAGVDTVLSLGYVYNGNATDQVYGANPPATGFDFFQGPIVAGEAGDTATFGGHKVPGMKNLGASAFYYFINSDPIYRDPALGEYEEGTLEMYNLMQGLIGSTGEPFPVPGGGTTHFPLSGDPVAQTGYLDGFYFGPDDRRYGLASGPFEMAPGDTQEIVLAQIVAGGTPGINNIQAVQLLKQYDAVAQDAYLSNFVLPSPPPLPMVTVSNLDQEVILSWSQPEGVARTESHSLKGYEFQGYNVYQLPSPSASVSEGTRIATYDVIDEVKVIKQPAVDPASGETIEQIAQYGSDSGIKRFIRINRDFLKNKVLINGTRYYYAVTAYAYNPDPLAVPSSLENPITVVTAVPQTTTPGVRYGNISGDTLQTNRVSGISNGDMIALVVDPSKTTGHEYRVTFNADGTWNLVDATTGQTKLANQENQTGNDDYMVVDGILVKVTGPPNGFAGEGAGIVEVMYAGAPVNTDAAGAPYGGNSVWHGLNWAGNAGETRERYFVSGGGGGGGIDRLSRWADYLFGRDFEMRFTEQGGYGVFAFTTDKIVRVPFEIWDVGVGTFDDPSDDHRMIPFINPNGDAEEDWGTPTGTDAYFGQYDISDWVYWMDPDPSVPDGYARFEAAAIAAGGSGATYPSATDGSPSGYWANFPGGNFVYPIGRVVLSDFDENGVVSPPPGSVIRFNTYKPNTEADVFSFTAPEVSSSTELAKEDVDLIKAFPNPYYGVNPHEINKYERFVTFSHMPARATVRIFNLAGQLVRTMEKNDTDQFFRWDLANDNGVPVASGLFVVYIDMPEIGATKILKVAIIQEQQILDRF